MGQKSPGLNVGYLLVLMCKETYMSCDIALLALRGVPRYECAAFCHNTLTSGGLSCHFSAGLSLKTRGSGLPSAWLVMVLVMKA